LTAKDKKQGHKEIFYHNGISYYPEESYVQKIKQFLPNDCGKYMIGICGTNSKTGNFFVVKKKLDKNMIEL
jgi:hypothetical protein